MVKGSPYVHTIVDLGQLLPFNFIHVSSWTRPPIHIFWEPRVKQIL